MSTTWRARRHECAWPTSAKRWLDAGLLEDSTSRVQSPSFIIVYVFCLCVLCFSFRFQRRSQPRGKAQGRRGPAPRIARRTVREAFAKRCIQEHNGPRVRRARSARRSGNNFAQPYARQHSYAHRGHLHRVVVPAPDPSVHDEPSRRSILASSLYSICPELSSSSISKHFLMSDLPATKPRATIALPNS